MHPNFLLSTDAARELYNHVAHLPIIDYHCHLSPREIAEDRQFDTITQLWLGGDHYKWRAMRVNGTPERYITGDATDWEKFQAWAATVPHTLRNPLSHWTMMELHSAFGIDEPLCPDNARRIYDECNRQLRGLSARRLMLHYNVEAVCTTDDPMDDLRWHRQIRESGFRVKVLPAWRPDRYLDGSVSLEELDQRHQFFHDNGCRLADHGLTDFAGDNTMLLALATLNHRRGWAQQFHFGPLRNTRTRLMAALGPDAGGDTIGSATAAAPLARFLDALDSNDRLAPTILYNINPADNAMTAAMAATFCDGSRPGKVQWGAAWWFSDHLLGMREQLNTLSAQGLLSRFVGMLTDSRSFLSYPRHDYFRRILCRQLGNDIEQGLIPASQMPTVAAMACDICHHNAQRYFQL